MAKFRTKTELEDVVNLVTSLKISTDHDLKTLRRSQENPFEICASEAATLYLQTRSEPLADEVILSYIKISNDNPTEGLEELNQIINSNDDWKTKADKSEMMLSMIDARGLSRAELEFIHKIRQKLLFDKTTKNKNNKSLREQLEQRFRDMDSYATDSFEKPDNSYDRLADILRETSNSSNTLKALTTAYTKLNDDIVMNPHILEAGRLAVSTGLWGDRLFSIEDNIDLVNSDNLNEHEQIYIAHLAGYLRKNKAISENVFIKPRKKRTLKKISKLLGDQYEQYSVLADKLYEIRLSISELVSMDYPYSIHEETEQILLTYDTLKTSTLSTAPFQDYKEIEKVCRDIERNRNKITQVFQKARAEYDFELEKLVSLDKSFKKLAKSESGVRAAEISDRLTTLYDIIKQRTLSKSPIEEIKHVKKLCMSIDYNIYQVYELELRDLQSYNRSRANLDGIEQDFRDLAVQKPGRDVFKQAGIIKEQYDRLRKKIIKKAPYKDIEQIKTTCRSIANLFTKIKQKEDVHDRLLLEMETKESMYRLHKVQQRFNNLLLMNPDSGAEEEASILFNSSYSIFRNKSLKNASPRERTEIDQLCTSIEKNYISIKHKKKFHDQKMERRSSASVRFSPESPILLKQDIHNGNLASVIPLTGIEPEIDIKYINEKITAFDRFTRGVSSTLAASLLMFILLLPNKAGNAVTNLPEGNTTLQDIIEEIHEDQTGQSVNRELVAEYEREQKLREKKEFLKKNSYRTEFADIEFHKEYLTDSKNLDELTVAINREFRKTNPKNARHLNGASLPIKYTIINGKTVPFILRDGLLVTSDYGFRTNPFIRRDNRHLCKEGNQSVNQDGHNLPCKLFHSGIDLVYVTSQDLYAMIPGVITDISFNARIGHSIEYKGNLSDGTIIVVKYVHMKERPKHLKIGDEVHPFDTVPIGQYGDAAEGDRWPGTTGKHVHLEISTKGTDGVKRIRDPEKYIPIEQGEAVATHIYRQKRTGHKDSDVVISNKPIEKREQSPIIHSIAYKPRTDYPNQLTKD